MIRPRWECSIAVAACAWLTAACAGGARVDERGAGAFPDTVTGTVRRAGNLPFVRTLVEGEDTVAVSGPHEEELARLVGSRVRVVGRRDTAGRWPGAALEVAGYELLAVDGEQPEVGFLRRDGEGFYLEREEGRLRLAAISPGLAREVGAKVWVLTGAGGSVLRYGVIRPPP